MFWIFVVALWVAMLLSPIALLIAFLPPGRECPRCGEDTVLLRSRLLRPVRSFLQQRWCMACGWDGVMRRSHRTRVAPAAEPLTGTPHEVDDDAAWRGNEA